MPFTCVTLTAPLTSSLGVTVNTTQERPLLTVTAEEEFSKETLLAKDSAFYVAGARGPKGDIQLSHLVDALKKARPLTLVLTTTLEDAEQLSLAKTYTDKAKKVLAVNGQTTFDVADIDKAEWLVLAPNTATVTVSRPSGSAWDALKKVGSLFV